MDNYFRCHKHLGRNIYRLGKPWRPLHYPPLSQSAHLCFEFYWQKNHCYYNVPEQIPFSNLRPIKTSQEPEDVFSRPVNRLLFVSDDSYARWIIVNSLIAKCNFTAEDFVVDWMISNARLLLQKDQDCQTLLIGLESVRYHLCYESVLVRRVMAQSFEESRGITKPASISSLELLKSVDFEKAVQINGGDESLPCVICQEEFGIYKDKKILCMPCSHMFHGECILLWLQNSHYCPLCRFELPTT